MEHYRACFQLLAGFFYPARVTAFDSLERLHGAALADPDAFARATTYVQVCARLPTSSCGRARGRGRTAHYCTRRCALPQCDAEPIDIERSRALAEHLLVEGGLGFVLRNHGHFEFDLGSEGGCVAGCTQHKLAARDKHPEHNRQVWRRDARGMVTLALAPAEGRGARLLAFDDADRPAAAFAADSPIRPPAGRDEPSARSDLGPPKELPASPAMRSHGTFDISGCRACEPEPSDSECVSDRDSIRSEDLEMF